jgi:hypothetical protein
VAQHHSIFTLGCFISIIIVIVVIAHLGLRHHCHSDAPNVSPAVNQDTTKLKGECMESTVLRFIRCVTWWR